MAFDFDQALADALQAGLTAAEPGGKAAKDWLRRSADSPRVAAGCHTMMVGARSSRAPAKNGRHANSSTGVVSARLAQRRSCPMSALISPSPAMYAGSAYIITCIMPKPATNSRPRASRRSPRSSASTRCGSWG